MDCFVAALLAMTGFFNCLCECSEAIHPARLFEHFTRLCERSEAIQKGSKKWIASSLRSSQ
jgi:hypothetical protein